MSFLPPNQQRQSIEGTKTAGNTIQNKYMHTLYRDKKMDTIKTLKETRCADVEL